MNLPRSISSISPDTAHAVGAGSGLTGLALWTDFAQNMTIFAGFVAAGLAVAGAFFYAAYWALKMYAKWHRIKAGDFEE